MSVTTIGAIEHAIHTTNEWLRDLMQELDLTTSRGIHGSPRPSFREAVVGPITAFLTRVAVRAAQHYGVHCLQPRIVPERVVATSKRADSSLANQ